jgi:hypothetical protein
MSIVLVACHAGDQPLIALHKGFWERSPHLDDEKVRLPECASTVAREVAAHLFKHLGRPANAVKVALGSAQ